MTAPTQTAKPTAGHTPGPWHFETTEHGGVTVWATRNGDDDKHIIGVVGYGPITDREANAAFIVRACNSFEPLVAALKAHDAYMSAQFSEGPDSDVLHPKAAANWRTCRAALSLAQGNAS